MKIKTNSEKHFDEWSKTYKKINSQLPYFLKWNINKIIKEINFSINPTILDLGTGDGILLLQISKINPKCKFIGLDISNGMINNAKKNFKKVGLKGKFIKSSMDKINLKDNSVDYVISNAAVHHVKDKQGLFSEIYRILKKDGKLIISDSFEKEDLQYKKKRRELKKQYPKIFNKYVKNVKKCEEETINGFKQMKTPHPKEYHLKPKDLKRILKKEGFKKINILPTPYYFGIYSAKK